MSVRERTMLLDLIVEAGRIRGITVLREGAAVEIRADAVILATGGAGQLYAHTTNPIEDDRRRHRGGSARRRRHRRPGVRAVPPDHPPRRPGLPPVRSRPR
ncbi:FAD-binding protein [Microbacterium sp. NRRL B-14842]|uniref:FAD-binding protein n=1 Tax=Microbacterium sp. NRRL B-14842 TaxID=3162881 RepID=UPI003D2BADF8